MGRKHTVLLLAVALVVAGVPTTLGAVGSGDAAQTDVQDTTDEELVGQETTTEALAEDTTTQAPAEAPSLRVESLDLPATIVLDESPLNVTAEVENAGEETVTESVQLRVNGRLVALQTVEVGPGETAQVQFEVDKNDLLLEPGQAFVGVLTRDFGQVAVATVTEPTETTEVVEETTTEVVEETTTEIVEETTTEAVEETTTEAFEETTTVEAPEETTTEVAGAPSLEVTALDVPESIVLDDGTLAVTAELENPSDGTVTETVQFRVDGTVVTTKTVVVAPGETASVEFLIEKPDLDLEPGEAFVEVLTRNFGESTLVTVEEPAEETTTAAAAETTTAAAAETTTEPAEETTEEVVETTTEEAVETTEEPVETTTEEVAETTTEEVVETTEEVVETTEEIVETTTETETATTTESAEETTTAVAETTAAEAEAEAEAGASLTVSLDATGSVRLANDTVLVSAQVENPTDEQVTGTVQFRVGGSVVTERRVEVDPGETVTVEFETTAEEIGLEPLQALIDVLTGDLGRDVTVTVEGAGEETTTTAQG